MIELYNEQYAIDLARILVANQIEFIVDIVKSNSGLIGWRFMWQ